MINRRELFAAVPLAAAAAAGVRAAPPSIVMGPFFNNPWAQRHAFLEMLVKKLPKPRGFFVGGGMSAMQHTVFMIWIDDLRHRRCREQKFRCSSWAIDIDEPFWNDYAELTRVIRLRHGEALRQLL